MTKLLIENTMVRIPQGSINLRDDRKKTSWSVEVQSFEISKYQVTQALYEQVIAHNPSGFVAPENPVDTVSWFDAIVFCNALSADHGLAPYYDIHSDGKTVTLNQSATGFRLPTDAEWEYACRGGSQEARYGELADIAWYQENSSNTTHNVGLKQANDFGLYDMLGNLWEWCWDLYDSKDYGNYRIFRGGGWADEPRSCLASNRRRSHPTYKIDDLGFRIARSI